MNGELVKGAFDVAKGQTRATLAYIIVGCFAVCVVAIVIRAVISGQLDVAIEMLKTIKEVAVLVVGFYFITQGVLRAVNGGEHEPR